MIMSMKVGFRGFSKQINEAKKEFEKQSLAFARLVVTDITQGLLVESPVKTGAFRANWDVRINNTAISERSIRKDEASIESALLVYNRLNRTIRRIKWGDTVYIGNPLFYGINIEYTGWYKTAAYRPITKTMIKVAARYA